MSNPVHLPERLGSASELDPEKRIAVETTEGPLLVIAGPGSGKTRTLVERTVRLIQAGTDPANIFVATFTEKAASELITRISNRLLELELPVNLNEMWVGTLHSLFLRILDDHREFTRLKRNYRVLDQFDQRYFIYRRIREFNDSPHSSTLLHPGRSSGWNQADTVVAYVNKVSEELLDPEALKADGFRKSRISDPQFGWNPSGFAGGISLRTQIGQLWIRDLHRA